MKKRNKIKWLIFSIILLSISAFYIGCKPKETHTSQEIAEQFLKEIFTSNYKNRYVKFLEDENIDKYYKSFSFCASQECIEKLQKNRMPLKYDKEAIEKGISYIVSNIELEFDTSRTGTFEVFLTDESKAETPTQKATGQFTFENGKITDFFLSNIVPYEE